MPQRNIGLATWILLGAAALGGCSGHPPTGPGATQPPAQVVKIQTVQTRKGADHLELAATLEAVQEATLSSKLPGRIVALPVNEGDHVHAGEVLVQVDPSDLEAQADEARAGIQVAQASILEAQEQEKVSQTAIQQAIAQERATAQSLQEARTRLQMAQQDNQRYQFLAKEGAVSRQRAEMAETEYQSARARVAQLEANRSQSQAAITAARAQWVRSQAAVGRAQAGAGQSQAGLSSVEVRLRDTQIRAPFDGVVTEKLAWTGETASPGRPLLKVQDVRHLRLRLSLPEAQLALIRPHMKLPIEVSGGGRVDAEVTHIVPSADPASRSFVAKLKVNNPSGKLFPGMYARVDLKTGDSQAVWVPNEALVQRGQLEGVFVSQDGKASFRLVRSGRVQGQETEILSGLEGNEQVVLQPPSQLTDGQPLEAR